MDLAAAADLERRIDHALAGNDFSGAGTLVAHYLRQAEGTRDSGDLARSTWFRSRWLACQVALDAGRLEECQSWLAELLPLADRVPEALARRLWLYAAEARARLGQKAEAGQALANFTRRAAPGQPSPLLALRELRVRLILGQVRSLAQPLMSCHRLLTDHPDAQALLYLEEGRAWDAEGQLARAEACWQEGLKVLPRSRTGEDGSAVRTNLLVQLGRVAHLSGRLQSALDYLDEALCECPAGDRAQRLEGTLRLCLVRWELRQPQRAREELDQELARWTGPLPEETRGLAALARNLIQEGNEGRENSGTLEQRGYLAACRGDRDLALALYERSFYQAEGTERQARAALALAQVLWTGQHRERRPDLERWLDLAESKARAADLPEVLWRALEVRGQLASAWDGDDARARSCFEEAAAIAEGQRQRFRRPADALAYQTGRQGVTRLLLAGACARNDPAAAFRFLELDRGRLLLDLWSGTERGPLPLDPRLAECDRRGAPLRQTLEQLTRAGTPIDEDLRRQWHDWQTERDRLVEQVLSDRARAGNTAFPTLPTLEELRESLPQGAVFLAALDLGEDLSFLALRRGAPAQLVSAPSNSQCLWAARDDFFKCLKDQIWRYDHGFSIAGPDQEALTQVLDRLGASSLGEALTRLVRPGERVFWAPDGRLHGLPLAAVRVAGRHVVEDHEIVQVFSGSFLAHQARVRPGRRRGRAVIVAEQETVLKAAGAEADGVAASFFRPCRLQGKQADRQTLRPLLASTRVLHLACHAYFDAARPLAAHLALPSGESWHAVEWLDEPVRGLPLATLSACRSGEVEALAGREVFGLVLGVLAAGVRAVLAGLWPVPDREAAPLMWRFYRHRLTSDLASALARTQREAITVGLSPLFWAVFALFGDPAALPAPGWLGRWLGRWKQHRLDRRFPLNPPAVVPS